MLAEIAIENLGVIPHASLELSKGLSVLTGETGAGKTMIITSLRLLTGGRADSARVRVGSEQAVVDGTFSFEGINADQAEKIDEYAQQLGAIVDENGEYLASRVVKASGRSKAYLGGKAIPAAHLGKFSTELLTIHGQNDQLRLLNSDKQRDALDRLDPSIKGLVSSYQESFFRWRELSRDLEKRTASRMQLAQEADRLEYAIKEITDIDPQPGEEQELVEQIRRLQDADELREASTQALVALDGSDSLGDFPDNGESAASDLLGQAEAALSSADDVQLGQLASRLAEARVILGEVSAELGTFLSHLPTDAQELEQLLTRQQQLKTLTRKYAPDIDGVLAWLAKAETKLASLDSSPEALEKLKHEVDAAYVEAKEKAASLTEKRRAAAKQLAELVTEELHGLSMPKAIFHVALTDTELHKYGCNEVEFQLAANSAMAPQPLHNSASGGELSRVMLALEVILSAGNHGNTLVFDEVDAGVGGRAAVEIGRRLARLATKNQVIVVTHLPQVAAFADTHLHVSKEVGDESVSSVVTTLSDEERVEELARMLAGLDDTDTGRAHAKELLQKAQTEVAGMRRV
ncbi:DNA repair protein RecN [Corynebacterium sp. sy017]|uniref:DNA repair protein RecN n=1 Tax=unclassified Corynebacterium TaxID=2624378 RepID=UPI001184761C|nr:MULTISPECIES: DNA repair protein RecN [unclassified Corynebacterium]MBP3087553.1 DNA repair protein RecN [Corynebacterium sp. sy017]TSD92131.1 DNA repair protein RecN [Corynebacterium sp. SY003]